MIKISIALALAGLGLLLLSVLSAGLASPAIPTPTSPPAADAAYGKALFSAKGCVTCHHHDAVAGSGIFGGEYGVPDLTARHLDAAYLRRWLKDPSAVKPGTEMPTLGLSDEEIEGLIAFLNTGATN